MQSPLEGSAIDTSPENVKRTAQALYQEGWPGPRSVLLALHARTEAAERERDMLRQQRNEYQKQAQTFRRDAETLLASRDEAVRLLEPFVQFNTSEAVLTITVPASAVTAARAFLSTLSPAPPAPEDAGPTLAALTEDKADA